jgi:hypothetical protein
MNAFKQFWIQYADFSSKTSRAHFWLAFFWNSLISLPLWVFYIVTSLSHQNAQETLNFSTVHSKTGLWALAFLAFFYFLILVPSQAICVRRLRDAGIHWSWIFLNLGPVLLYLLTGLDIFLFLWGIAVVSLLILMMLPGKNTFPQPVVTPLGVASEQRETAVTDSFGGNSFESIPSFVAAPDLSDEKPPLEQKMAAEHDFH